jgi:hypothetical protein
MSAINVLAIYAMSVLGGYLIAGGAVWLIRKQIGKPKDHFFDWLDLWVGGTERFIATTLLVFTPQYLPAFIGAWVAAKFAANWNRQPDSQKQSMVALLGSAFSFAVAIGAGLLIRPEVLTLLGQALTAGGR